MLPLAIAAAGMAACGGDDPASTGDGDGADTLDTTPPAAITDLRAESPTTTSIALVWTSPGDDDNTGTASEYDLRYSSSLITEQNWDAATQADGEPVPKPAGEVETFRVLSLESGTVFHFAMKASDEVPNTSELSNGATDSTDDEGVAPAAVSDLSAQAVDDVTVRLTWTSPGDDDNTGTASLYDIRYSTSRITEGNWDAAVQVDGERVPKTAGIPDTLLVSGLESATNYIFALKTADEVPNWSGISNLGAALAVGNNLWIFPDRVRQGRTATIVYRTPDTGTSKLHAHYRDEAEQWSRLVIQFNWPPGIHTREWDFQRSNNYHYYPFTFYTFKLYWNTVVVADAQAWLDP